MANTCCTKGECSKEFCKSAAPTEGAETPKKAPDAKQEKAGHCTPKAGGCGCK